MNTGPKRATHRWLDAAALATLAALILIFFYKIALTDRILAGVDVFSYFYPYRDYVSQVLRSGQLPLWNPYLFMGAPLLANSQAAVLYPLHWPLIWLDPPKQVAWSIVLHVWLAGAGAYLLARRAMKLRPAAALVAGGVFSLGGFLGAQVEHLNQLNASAWLPWLLLCLEGTLARQAPRAGTTEPVSSAQASAPLDGSETSPPGTVRGWREQAHGRMAAGPLAPQRWLSLLAGGVVAALTFLAGHTQAAYIVFVGAALYALLRGLSEFRELKGWQRLTGLRGLGALFVMGVGGILLAAAQLLPTLELSRLSVRSSGLPYEEAASFSLKPGLIFEALLPPLAWPAPFSEFVAYVGVLGLVLAGLGVWTVLKRRRREAAPQSEAGGAGAQTGTQATSGTPAVGLALLGLFLAFGAYNPVYYLLYKLVPGFDLFRAPARWLLLYAFGMALLAGIGLESLAKRTRLTLLVALLLVTELFVAGRKLAYSNPTAPTAFDSMRSAPAHLLSSAGTSPFRFLSLSDITYDPGDLADLQLMYGQDLPAQAVYDLVVATKMKEVLAYDLPLRYRLSSVDGYDGGLLPTSQFVSLERLFLSAEEIWPDGRLRQQLHEIPPARLLSLLNVRYVVTDKSQDAWIDDVYYDLEHTVELGSVKLTDLPDFEATQLGVVSYLTGTADLTDGMPVAQVIVTSSQGTVVTETLRAGEDTSEGLAPSAGQQPADSGARIVHHWRQNERGNDYLAVLDLGQAVRAESIMIRSLLPDEPQQLVALRGLTLVDSRTHTSRSVSVNPAYHLVHSGDVKIYENMAVQPRAFVVHTVTVVPDDDGALALMRQPSFDPTREVVLAGEPLSPSGAIAAASSKQQPPLGGAGSQASPPASGSGGDAQATVQITASTAERVELRVTTGQGGYLVLTDAYYPGWTATVDSAPVPIARADIYFRAVPLEPGEHTVTFQYRPAAVRLGAGLSLVSWLALALAAALWALAAAAARHRGTKASRIGRRSSSGV